MKLKTLTLTATLLCTAVTPALAEISDNTLNVVVLTDMSSVYSAPSGKGSVAAAELAIEDFKAESGINVDLTSADHQNKPDLGALLAHKLIDTAGADVFVDISNSSVSLAVQDIVREADKAVLHVGSANAALYGESCSPNGALWLYDTYALAQGLGRAIVAEGGDSWFFITADYSFGTAMQEAMEDILRDAGGTVAGSVKHPVGNSDFSSFILQAQGSGAKIVGMANAANDTVNTIKTAGEFGLTQAGQKLAALVFYIQSAHAVGPQLAQGLRFMTGYYWDRDEASRAFAERFSAKMNGSVPSQVQAGVYSATLHYLRAAAAAETDAGSAVLEQMRKMPVKDFFADGAMLREDGRLMNDMYLVEVKTPDKVTGEWDLLKVLRTMPAEEIVRPVDKGNCGYLND